MRIKGWKKFQHFKDRKPPWIKLYRDLLDDIEWHNLSGDAAKSLVMLWLIASENDGLLPDIKTLSFRLRISENTMKSIVSKLDHWLIKDDINMISSQYQNDTPETEKETETYKEETEADWLSALRLNPAYKLIDIETELNKMKAWCEANKKIASKRRFINWLNRAETPLSGKSNGTQQDDGMRRVPKGIPEYLQKEPDRSDIPDEVKGLIRKITERMDINK